MPYIIKNGLTYTGNLMPITQVQYDALSEAEKNNGIAYFIVDSDAVLDASDVGLGEGNVEDLAGSVATIETSPATAIHAVGDFILWNGQLYTVISRIEVGQALTVGSNITATSAGSELSSLKAGLTILTFAGTVANFMTSYVPSQNLELNRVYSATFTDPNWDSAFGWVMRVDTNRYVGEFSNTNGYHIWASNTNGTFLQKGVSYQ